MEDTKYEKEWANFIMDTQEYHELAMKILFKRLCKLEEEVKELRRKLKISITDF